MENTTFFKWFFTDKSKIIVFLVSFLMDILLITHKDELLGQPLALIIGFIALINCGWIILLIIGIIKWQKEKNKLY